MAAWPFMDGMSAIPMPGGWSLSTVWLPVCGRSWPGAWLHFTTMWAVMMVPMMLPAVARTLVRIRRGGAASGTARTFIIVALVAGAWSTAWIALGGLLFPMGAVLAQLLQEDTRLARMLPMVSLVAALVGSVWHLHSCTGRRHCNDRAAPPRTARGATQLGLRLGSRCVVNCAGLTLTLLAAGMTDWRVMIAGFSVVLFENLGLPIVRRQAGLRGDGGDRAGCAAAAPARK